MKVHWQTSCVLHSVCCCYCPFSHVCVFGAFVCYQVAQTTSSPAIIRPSLPRSTLGWCRRSAPKQVLWAQSEWNRSSPVITLTVYLHAADVNRSVERAWIELEGIEAIVKTASKAKFFIEFHSSCLEGRGKKVLRCSAAAQQQKLSFCRDAALEWERLAGLRHPQIPQTGMVLQTTAKG